MKKSTYSYSYNSVTKSILIQRDRELIGVVDGNSSDRAYKSGTDIYGRCPELTMEDIAEIHSVQLNFLYFKAHLNEKKNGKAEPVSH